MIERVTSETTIRLKLGLATTAAVEGSRQQAEPSTRAIHCNTGVPFFDHMLTAFAYHGGFQLTVEAEGDLEVEAHHLVEDVGLCLGQALKQALGDHRGIARFGHAIVPMDEALVATVVDISGRPYLAYQLDLPPRQYGAFHTELVEEFLRAFAMHSGITLHVRQEAGRNAHHIAEACFKSLGRALAEATQEGNYGGLVPSTKGKLDGTDPGRSGGHDASGGAETAL